MNEHFTPEFIAAQRALAEKATPRPYYYGTDPDQQYEYEATENPLTDKQLKIIASPGDGSHIMGIWADGEWTKKDYHEFVEINAIYLTAAANNYPASLDEIERLNRLIKDCGFEIYEDRPGTVGLKGREVTYLPVRGAEMEAPHPYTCTWKTVDEDNNVWGGECGSDWMLDEGTPEENDMKFCPNCGRPLVQVIRSLGEEEGEE